jgi:signal transduction histidine kinase
VEAGRTTGFEEGRSAGIEEGRQAGFEKGRAAGIEEGRAAGRDEGSQSVDEQFRALIEAVGRGLTLEDVEPGSAIAELQTALEQGWAPRETEREIALREAIGRVSAFLQKGVRGPLTDIPESADLDEVRERIAQSLGAIQDLDFFLSEIDEVREGTDLSKLVQGVSREFVADQEVGVRLMLSASSVRAEVNPTALMDALYLVLHNASRFGAGTTIDLAVDASDGRAQIVVRDRGDGFTEEAFSRAFDPFYSTSDEGLGLGLPHARRVIEGMGGRIELRNVPDGGAEVEISFPSH